MKKEKLITILGPTASGKTELGVYLAKNWEVLLFQEMPSKFIKEWT